MGEAKNNENLCLPKVELLYMHACYFWTNGGSTIPWRFSSSLFRHAHVFIWENLMILSYRYLTDTYPFFMWVPSMIDMPLLEWIRFILKDGVDS